MNVSKPPGKGRIIGRYTGPAKGPLTLCLGAMHGNEPAGAEALETLFRMLEEEPAKNPGFHFKGRVAGLIGNVRAYQKSVRYIDKDLNRQFPGVWGADSVPAVYKEYDAQSEDLEMTEFLTDVWSEIRDYRPEQIYVLDLHTTSAGGGIFSLPSDDPQSLALAQSLHAPVVMGMTKGIEGATLHYFNTANMGVPTVAVSFEGGRHDDPLSAQRCLSVAINFLRYAGCVKPADVESRHDEILRAYAAGLPEVVELAYTHAIQPGDGFVMKPGYENFQAVAKGEILASDRNGHVRSPMDALILMPLYQPKGSDGFFLVTEKKN